MPKVAIVDGVRIDFYMSEHPPPHFHAIFAEYRAQIEIRGPTLLRGDLPPAKLRAVLLWAKDHKAELLSAWSAVEARRKPKVIG